MPFPRHTLSRVALGLAAIPLVALIVALWTLVEASAWQRHSDSVRFASLQSYASELTLLPAPATPSGSYQTSESGLLNAGGPDYTLSIERDYTFKSPVSPQTVYSYYNSRLANRGWSLDASQTNTPNNSTNSFTWTRAGTYSDTIFYTVTYYYDGSAPPVYGGGTAPPLQLEIESVPNNTPST
jgi:hypothetical protein